MIGDSTPLYSDKSSLFLSYEYVSINSSSKSREEQILPVTGAGLAEKSNEKNPREAADELLGELIFENDEVFVEAHFEFVCPAVVVQVEEEVGFGGRRSFEDDTLGNAKWEFDFEAYFLLYIVQSLSLRGIF